MAFWNVNVMDEGTMLSSAKSDVTRIGNRQSRVTGECIAAKVEWAIREHPEQQVIIALTCNSLSSLFPRKRIFVKKTEHLKDIAEKKSRGHYLTMLDLYHLNEWNVRFSLNAPVSAKWLFFSSLFWILQSYSYKWFSDAEPENKCVPGNRELDWHTRACAGERDPNKRSFHQSNHIL